MPRFHYTVVNDFMEEDVDASFLSDEEFVVGDTVPLGNRRYLIERIVDKGGTEWNSEGRTTIGLQAAPLSAGSHRLSRSSSPTASTPAPTTRVQPGVPQPRPL